MGRRRQFGAIRQLPSGRYQARLPDGTTAPTTFSTKADANRWLSATETDLVRDAADLELIAKAPTRGVKLPPIPATDVVVLRPEEINELADEMPLRWRPTVYVAAVCGLRSAEVIGLRVGRLDLLRRQLHVVDTSPQVGPDRAEPKSAAGRRTVPMPAFLAEMLAEHLRSQGLDAGQPDALVFTAKRGGRLWAGNFHGEAWKPAREKAGFPTLHFHHLRHSAVPMWVEMGANLLQVSRWLGHSSVKVTADVYGHLFHETNEAVMTRVDAAFRRTATAEEST